MNSNLRLYKLPFISSDEYVRFTNQTLKNEGVVENYRDGVWGGICKERLTAKEAQVVCRHFGLPVYVIVNFRK